MHWSGVALNFPVGDAISYYVRLTDVEPSTSDGVTTLTHHADLSLHCQLCWCYQLPWLRTCWHTCTFGSVNSVDIARKAGVASIASTDVEFLWQQSCQTKAEHALSTPLTLQVHRSWHSISSARCTYVSSLLIYNLLCYQLLCLAPLQSALLIALCTSVDIICKEDHDEIKQS